jgi:hypothetical protein
MGAERAVVATSSGAATLEHFNDEIIVKMELVGEDKWILMGTVSVVNTDGDRQDASAKLIHNANVVIHQVTNYIDTYDQRGMYLQAGFVANGRETITLECNTYHGGCQDGSLIALKVDDIEFQ